MDKITLYDLLSFLLPGSILIEGGFILNDYIQLYPATKANTDSFFSQFSLLLLAYIAGLAVHQIVEATCRRNKGDNNMLWKLKWITQGVENLKPERKEKLITYLQSNGTSHKSFSFQTESWSKMYKEVYQQKASEIKVLQSQTTMLINGSMAFLIITVGSIISILFTQQDQIGLFLLKYTAPLITFTLGCFFLAISRQKAIIRTVMWNYSIK